MKNNEFLAELLVSKAQSIPDQVKKAFVKRSVEDAKHLKLFIEADGEVDLEKLSFAIYKAYTLGAALYDGDKLIEEAEDNYEVEVTAKSDNNDSKIVHINDFKKTSIR